MNHYETQFLIETERRKGEMALAAQHRLVKEAQRAGMKIPPLLSLKNVDIGPLAVILAHGLDWLSHLFAMWSCRLHYRYTSAPLGVSPESQSDPCAS